MSTHQNMKIGLFYQFSWPDTVRFLYFMIFHAFWTHQKMSKNWHFYIFQPRPMGPGPSLPSEFFFKLANPTVSLLGWTSKYHHNEFISRIFKENMPPLLHKLNLKSLTFSFSEWERDVFVRLWCHYRRIPPKIGDFPWFRVVTWVTTP